MFSLVIYFAALAGQSASTTTDLGWRRYVNGRYNYSTCYPSRLMQPGPRVDADDGRTFRSASGAELKAWASYAIDDVNSFATTIDGIRDDVRRAGATITYERAQAGWRVISGRSVRRIFWAKIMRRDDRIVVVWLAHPVDQARQYASVATRLNACTQLLDASY